MSEKDRELSREEYAEAFHLELKKRWTEVDLEEATHYLEPYLVDYGKPGFTFTAATAAETAKEVADEFSEDS